MRDFNERQKEVEERNNERKVGIQEDLKVGVQQDLDVSWFGKQKK